MGKNRHSKDRLFITQTEHKTDWGGKKDPTFAPIPKLSFNYCPLSLQPFRDPVCAPDGTIFDIVNIVPYLKRFGRNPVNGAPLKVEELVRLHFSQDAEENYICPISKKVFTDSTKIVAIKTSGMVYAASTVEELNKKQKFFFDLMTSSRASPRQEVHPQRHHRAAGPHEHQRPDHQRLRLRAEAAGRGLRGPR